MTHEPNMFEAEKLKLIFTSHPRQVVTRAVSSNFSETSRMDERGATRMFSRIDERATRMFSRMDESATWMSEWIEERMWLIETERGSGGAWQL